MPTELNALIANSKRTFFVEDAQIHAKALAIGGDPAKDPGFLEGYAVVWDVVDKDGEVFRRGAFKRSIEQMVPAGKAKLMVRHFRDGGDTLESVGTITQAREDDKGLFIHADFSPDAQSQSIRGKAASGHIKSLSVGFVPLQFSTATDPQTGKRIIEHKECKLLESTVTNRPRNDEAVITSAKSEPQSDATPRDTAAAASGSTLPAVAGKTAPTAAPTLAATVRARLALHQARARALGVH